MNLQAKLQHQVETLDPENHTARIYSIEREQPLDIVPSFAITLEEAKGRVQMLQDFVRDMMVPGLDYGVVPGVPKPTLFKPGAEKLTDIFGFSKQVEVMNRVEDWEMGLFSYEIKVSLINKRNQLIEAEGIGCCNSREKKYRSQDPYNIINTVLKMAKKRALIDAVLSATRSSGLFTQDVEDLEQPLNNTAHTYQPAAAQTPQSSQPNFAPITQPQLRKIQALAENIGMTPQHIQALIQEMFRVNHTSKLTKNQASVFIQHLLSLQ